MADLHLPAYWRERLIAVLGGRTAWTHDERHRFLAAWAKAEGGTAQWNPLNTTYYLANSWPYNEVGVRNYKRPVEGICATALTLVNGLYAPLLGKLQGSRLSAEEIVESCRDDLEKWGTNPDTILSVLRS